MIHPKIEPGSELERMLAGELYLAYDPQLTALRRAARALTRVYNHTTEEEVAERSRLLRELFGQLGPGADVEPPFHCDYGFNIHAGERLFMNFGCVILDCAPVTIGSGCLFGPSVHVYAATHPLDAQTRRSGRELARPVRIGDDVWVGGCAVICPGVTIGSGAVIGAGSVVTRDVPDRAVVAGSPARSLR